MAGSGKRITPSRQVRLIVGAATLAVAAFVSGPVRATEYATRDVGEWKVAASRDGTGCFLTRDYDRAGATTLLLGLDSDGTNHLSVLNTNWSIKPKERVELTFRLSKSSFPEHFAIGMAADGKQGFVTSFGAKFPDQFAASRGLDIFRGEVPVEKLSLEGSGAAVEELRTCVAAQRSKPVSARTEKETRDSIPKDPFAPVSERKRKK